MADKDRYHQQNRSTKTGLRNPVQANLMIIVFLMFLMMSAGSGVVTAARAETNQGVILTPTRVVFEGRKRNQVVRMVNPNDKTVTYALSLVTLRMDDSGRRYETVAETPAETQAIGMLRFSPRRATIEPGGWQTVRIMARKPAGLPDGEYRAHLKVAPLPDISEDAPVVRPELEADQVGIAINIVVNITIPIIVRQGSGTVTAEVSAPRVVPGDSLAPAYLEARLDRNGLYSIFADVVASYTEAGADDYTEIGRAVGIAVYTPNTWQTVRIPVTADAARQIDGGFLQLQVVDREKEAADVLGEAVFPVK